MPDGCLWKYTNAACVGHSTTQHSFASAARMSNRAHRQPFLNKFYSLFIVWFFWIYPPWPRSLALLLLFLDDDEHGRDTSTCRCPVLFIYSKHYAYQDRYLFPFIHKIYWYYVKTLSILLSTSFYTLTWYSKQYVHRYMLSLLSLPRCPNSQPFTISSTLCSTSSPPVFSLSTTPYHCRTIPLF